MTGKDENEIPENQPANPEDDLESLSLDEKAAFEKIMAEISDMNAGESTQTGAEASSAQDPLPEDVPGSSEASSADHAQSASEEGMSEDQQAALDKIMAEINARDAGSEPEPEKEKEPEPETDENLSEDQQAVTNINKTENRPSETLPDADGTPPIARNETDRLSLDEFNDELASLLSGAQPDKKEASSADAPSKEPEPARKMDTDPPAPALQAKMPETEVTSEAAEKPPEKSADPGAETPMPEKDPKQPGYAMLHEIDASSKSEPAPNGKTTLRGPRKFFKHRKLTRISAAALVAGGIVAVCVWAYMDLIPGQLKSTIRTSLLGVESPAPTAAAVTSPAAQLPGPVSEPNSDPSPAVVRQQSSPTSFGSLRLDLIAARRQVSRKIDEIVSLKAYYQKGIQDEQAKIRDVLQAKPAPSLEKALANSQIDLSVRAIQRRMVYIAKLDTPLERLENSSEDLLYLERRTQLFETLNQWISGPSIPEYKQEIVQRIQSHLQVALELSVEHIPVEPPAVESVWKDVLAALESEKKAAENRVVSSAQDRQIARELCSGDFSRKYMLTSLSAESVQCLVKWSGKDLYLNGLTELPPQLAKILVQWRGEWLSLNGIKEISIETAQYLSQWPGKRLSLNGLDKLSPALTAQLSQWQGEQLEMIGLTSIGRWENYSTRLFLSEALRRKLQM